MRPPADCDVLVAGGGPAGFAAAIALAGRGVDVLVADAAGAKAALARCEMLPKAAEPIMLRLGLQSVLAQSVTLQGVVSLWGSERPVDHAAASPGFSAFGWSVDREALQSAMKACAAGLGITACEGRVHAIQGRPGAWVVALGKGSSVRAKFLVDATGRPAAVARRLGAKAIFGASLVAWTWSTTAPVPPCLLAEARPNGWSYALPRPDAGGSMGYLMCPSIQRQKRFSREPINMCGRLVPDFKAASVSRPVDCRSMRLVPAAGSGWLATGDAAAAFDPISSQGLFNALSGGFFAGNAAADALDQDESAVDIYRTLANRTAARTHRQIPHQYAVRPYETDFWTHMSRHSDLNKGVVNAV